eukprot:m51a1_g6747 hypothetical protein (119) ;mRNA; f:270841-271269
MSFEYVSCESLALLLREESTAVVDVRGAGGAPGSRIAGSLSSPCGAQFAQEVDALARLLARKSIVVFYCQRGQTRSPICAGVFAQRLQELGLPHVRVAVLRGGFDRFESEFMGSSLIE